MGYLVLIEDERESKSKHSKAETGPVSLSGVSPAAAAAKAATANTEQEHNKAQQSRCHQCLNCILDDYHLPVFTLLISLIQMAVFTFFLYCYCNVGARLAESRLIYCPLQKHEAWRFVSYMLVHSSCVHLIFNIFVQLVVGLPLEIVHGFWRAAVIYITGVLAGSLSVSVFAPNVCLVGASSGIYALLAAHLSHVLLNYKNLEFVGLRVVGVILIAIMGNSGVGLGPYGSNSNSLTPWSWFLDSESDSDFSSSSTRLPVSELAHFAGAFAGLTMGLVVLKGYSDTDTLWGRLLRWFAFGLNGGFLVTLILFTCQQRGK